MERTTQIGIGLVVLAALAGGVYFKAKEDSKIGTTEAIEAELPDLKVEGDVDKISITNADKGEVVLEKKGDTWEVVKPVAAPANQTNVKTLVDNLKELKAKELVASAPSEEQKKEFQFEPSKAVHVVAYKGADKKLDATFGKAGARGQMAMVDGKPGVYTVTGYTSYSFARDVKGWRDVEILKFDDANASQLQIENKNGKLSFGKGGGGDKWGGSFKDKPIAELDEDKVKEALRAFKSLNADDFGDGKTPAETGLDSPESKVTVTLKDNAGTYVLKVGKVASGNAHYAQKEGNPTIFVIGQTASDFALADAAKFQKPKDAGADAAKGAGAPHLDMPAGLTMPNPHGMGGMDDPHGH